MNATPSSSTVSPPMPSALHRLFARLWAWRAARAWLLLLCAVILLGLAVPFLPLDNSIAISLGQKFALPSSEHWLGLKVCYTGQSLYEYAYKQGNILDGKGTKLEKGVMSDLMEIHGKPGKLRFNDDGNLRILPQRGVGYPGQGAGKEVGQERERTAGAGLSRLLGLVNLSNT